MNTSTSHSATRSHEATVALLGVTLAFVALFCGWYDPASSARLSAWQIGLNEGPVALGDVRFFSFGLAGFIICGVAAFAVAYLHRNLLILSSATLLFLGVDYFIQFAIVHPEWIEVAKEGARDFADTMFFANHYSVPDSYAAAPDSAILIFDGAIVDRIGATYSCVSYGWYWFIVGSLFALGGGYHYQIRPGQPACPLRLWALICFLIVLAQLSAPLAGEYYLWYGDRAAAQDRIDLAEHCYRKAMVCDGWYRVRPDLYLKIGALRQSHGDKQSPEACFSIGEDAILNKSYLLGLYWLNLAATSKDPDLNRQVLNEIARHAMTEAKSSYYRGAQGVAMQEWQRSLQARPQQVAPYYMLGKAYSDIGDMEQARKWFEQAKFRSTLPVLKSICLSGIGDTYYKTGELAEARSYYLASNSIYYSHNYRASKSLTDNYFR